MGGKERVAGCKVRGVAVGMWEGARMCRWLGGREGARMGGVGMVGKVDEELSPFTSMSFLVKSCLWAGPLFLGYAVTQILLPASDLRADGLGPPRVRRY